MMTFKKFTCLISIVILSNLLFAQNIKPFNGRFILVDTTLNHIVSFDTLSNSEGSLVYIYRDTMNMIDHNGMKQGLWLEDFKRCKFYHQTKPKEEIFDWPECIRIKLYGKYINDKRDGIWKAYYQNGNIRENFNYKNGELKGDFYLYYENGKLKMYGKQISSDEFEISRYNEQGILLIRQIQKSSEITF